jgi:glycosyltransferase involved in cell wall biosynthesis
MSPLKVLVIHNEYQQAAGEAAAVEAQVNLLQQHGHHLVFYRRDNADIAGFGVMDKAAFPADTLYSRRTYRDIRELAARERPHVAHVHNVFPLISPSVYRALKDARVPTVQTVHNYRFLCPNGLFYTHGQVCERCIRGNTLHAVRWRCYRDSYPMSALYALAVGVHRRQGTFRLIDRFVAPAAFTARKLIEGGIAAPDRVSVLNNFLPDPLPRPGVFSRRDPHILYLGRLSDEKGLRILLDAMRGLPKLRLKIFGTGPLEAPIRQYLARERVQNVEMGGFISGEAKWDALRSALAVVVPSKWYEVFPYSVIEGLTAGTAVVAPNHGNFPETVADQQTGLLFRAGDSGDLRETLAILAGDPDRALAMGQRAREVAEQRYTAARHYESLLDIYRMVA